MRLNNKKLAVGIFFILIIGFSFTSFLSYSVTRDYVLTSAETQTLPLISDNIYSDIKADLIDPINVSSLMANDAFLINWVHLGEDDLDSIKNYLGLIKQKYGYTSTFFVSDITGNYYYSDGILKEISEDDEHDTWYFAFKDMNTSIDLDIDNDEAKQGLMTVFINHRLEDAYGNFLGVTGVGLELTEIAENLSEYEELYDHQIYIVDRKGVIQIHSDNNLIEKANIKNMNGISDISDVILSTKDDVKIVEYRDTQGLKIISVRYIPEFNWYLIVEKNENTSLAGAKNSLLKNVLIGLFIAMTLSLVINQIVKLNNKHLEHQASFDDLTELFNRRSFLQILQRENSVVNRYQYSSALLMIDIDNFKTVNDQYGHYVGDAYLTEIVDVINETLRSSDSLGRWGGDEFIAYLFQVDKEEAIQVAERIKSAIKTTNFSIANDKKINRSVSIGIASFIFPIENVDDIIRKADDALIMAKNEGKDRIVFDQ